MDRYAIISSDADVCVNIIVWSGTTEYSPPPGTFIIKDENAQIGWVWNGVELVDPNPPEPEPLA